MRHSSFHFILCLPPPRYSWGSGLLSQSPGIPTPRRKHLWLNKHMWSKWIESLVAMMQTLYGPRLVASTLSRGLLCGLGNLWLGFLSAMSLCSRLLGGGHQDKWEEPKEEVSRFMLLLLHSFTGGEGRSSQWPRSHAISRPSLITTPSPSSSSIFLSLQPFPYFLSLPFLLLLLFLSLLSHNPCMALDSSPGLEY